MFMKPPAVSVIIVNWNTRDILRDCLRSVYGQTKELASEVVVIDNASTDGSQEMVKEEFPQLVLIENIENRGFAAANNQGIEIAKGRYVLLLNSDTVVLDGAIQKVVAFADQHPEAAVVGCKVLNPDRTLQATCFKFPSLLNLFLAATYLYKMFPRSHFFGRERMIWWTRDDVRPVDVVTGCFMLVRREAIQQVGRMDEQFFMYAEEADWCYRFRMAGWQNVFYPEAEIIHLGGQSSGRVRVAMTVQLRKAILQFIRKHNGYWSYAVGRSLVLMFYTVRIPFWLVLAIRPKIRGRALDMTRAYWKGSKTILTGK